MDLILDLASWVFLVAGAVSLVLGGFAILRMPSFYPRIHAASVNETLGPGLILLGLTLQSLDRPDVLVKIALVFLFLVLTGPVAAHALARAALEHGHLPQGYEGGDPRTSRKKRKGDPPSSP